MAQMRERKDASVLFKTIGMFAVGKIEEWLLGNECQGQAAVLSSKSNLKVPIYMPFLIQIACDFVEDDIHCWFDNADNNNNKDVTQQAQATVGRVLSFFALALTNPVCLVSILQNRDDTLGGTGITAAKDGSKVDESNGAYDALAVSTRLQSVLCLIDIVLKKYVTRRNYYRNFDDIISKEVENPETVFSGLLAVRWKVSGMQLVVGLPSDFRTFQIAWSSAEALQILPLLVKHENIDYRLSVSPLQALQALEVVRIAPKKEEKMVLQETTASLLKYCRVLLDISLKGALDRLKDGGRTLIDTDAMSNFFSIVAELTTEIMADPVFTKIHYEHDQQNQDMDQQFNAEQIKPSVDSIYDPQVGELLALVSAKNDSPHIGKPGGAGRDASGPPTKKKRIVPEKIKSEMGDVKNSSLLSPIETNIEQEESLVSAFSHKGRVIMPATFNMDSKTREALWTAYIEDKDRLVEMLGVCVFSIFCSLRKLCLHVFICV